MTTAAQRGWPVPVVYAVGTGPAGGRAAALGRLRAAVSAGRHDALLMPLPGALGDAGQFMGLLALCTRMGGVVAVAASIACSGVIPSRTRQASSAPLVPQEFGRPGPVSPMSVPIAMVTPRSIARDTASACRPATAVSLAAA